MGNDINAWRISIGLFDGRQCFINQRSYVKLSLYTVLECLGWCLNRLKLLTPKLCKTANAAFLNMQFIFILICLILQDGDVESNPGPENSHNCLSILHCNVRSIRNKLDYIRDNFLDFDILCFTESHLNMFVDTDFLLLSDKFSHPYRKDRTNHGGGLLVYMSKELSHSRVHELEVFCEESIWIKITINKMNYLIGLFYSPKPSDRLFFQNLDNNLEKAYEISKHIILLGDFNENLLNNNRNYLHEIMQINNLKDTVMRPTRNEALLDPILVTNDQEVYDSGTINTQSYFSDHKATYIHIPFLHKTNATYKRLIWIYEKANFDLLNAKINSFDWNCLFNGSLNEACYLFTSTFINFVKQCIPSREITVRNDDKPWYDSTIRKYSKLRDKQKIIASKTNKIEDWSKYKQFRNKVNNLKRHAKEIFFSNLDSTLTNLHYNDKRSFWKTIRHFIKNNKCSSLIPPLCKLDASGESSYLVSSEEKANFFNEYFASISTVDDTNAELPLFEPKTDKTFLNIIIAQSEVEDILGNLNINKACGPDLISHKMLKGVSKSVSKPLVILFNRSLRECEFPDSWKLAHVTPIFKKGDNSSVSNYRPVSLLSCCGKIMERIVFKYIYNYLFENNMLYRYQSGFLPNHSTTFQLIDIYHHICQAIDNKQLSCMIFCDISKAFDRVWHKGLLFKLREYGINGNVLNWISQYLHNRKQKVVLQSVESNTQEITAGVPQGSVLGPLLFLLYVNDIADNLLSLTRLYADDSSLFCSTSTVQDMEGIINHDLHLVSAWAKQWLVNFNPNKTEALIFCTRNNQPLPNLTFDSIPVKFVDHHKHLGVTLSSNCSWNKHIDNILCSAWKVVGIMRKMKFCLSRQALNQIYLSYIRPILEYSAIVWDGCTYQCSYSLELLQNEAARIVTGLTRSTSIENLYQECGWEALSIRRKNQKQCFMYKVKNDIAPSYIMDLFPPQRSQEQNYYLRNNEDINAPRTRTTLFKKSCIPSSISLWNSLDLEIRNSASLSSFKIKTSQTTKKINHNHRFLYGKRYFSVLHARLRNGCSDLNFDLYNNFLRDSPFCSCSETSETAEHFFFQCNKFDLQRQTLFQRTRQFHPLNVNLMLYGNDDLAYNDNIVIFDAVQDYIKCTSRFKTIRC